ncbi:MAG: GH3 auxin-responsive promoter family protein [Crocinitomicaceae bacterium]
MPFNSIFSWLIKKRIHQIDLFKKYPIEVQDDVLKNLISRSLYTEWGKQHSFSLISSYSEFANNVPLGNYETFQPIINRQLQGESNLLWEKEVKWFAKSSGTVSAKSKFIPVTKDSLHDCHYKGGKDLLGMYYNQVDDAKFYKGKMLGVGGSAAGNSMAHGTYFGDLSAILVENMPWWAEFRRTPSKEIALMDGWEEKIEKLAQSTINEDVTAIAGVPSWTLVLCNRVLEITGKKHLREVWPNLELFSHGGVSFEPYKAEFKKLIPFDDMHYLETYNASEGFFGIQDNLSKSDLLLMLDYGIFYEFIPMTHYNGIHSTEAIPLNDVELGVNYALVISTNGGLWRYIVGDTVKFTSLLPYRFLVTGRTNSFINAFGEELIVENAEKAIAKACKQTGAQVKDYTAAPIYMEADKKGAHEWLIEFNEEPSDMVTFIETLDDSLKSLNSDYEAKRQNNMSLEAPHVRIVPQSTFDKWLKSKGKLGGQHKVPRLNNNRIILEEIKALK